jgi:predicted RNase H-like nuclease (RuvC/YqgF family)
MNESNKMSADYVIDMLAERLDSMNEAYSKFVLNGDVKPDSSIAIENRNKSKQLEDSIQILKQTQSLQKQIEELQKELEEFREGTVVSVKKEVELQSQLSQKDEMLDRVVERLMYLERMCPDSVSKKLLTQYKNSKK